MKKYIFDLKQTNLIKGLMILLLIVHHVFSGMMEEWFYLIKAEAPTIFFTQFVSYGKVCVGGFCFLSAYGITQKFMKQEESVREIIISRIVKIYFAFWPFYIIGVIGGVLFADAPVWHSYISSQTHKFSWLLVIIDILGLSEFFKTSSIANSINASWWYVSAALMIVLIMPLFYQLYCKYKIKFIILITILIYILEVNPLSVLLVVTALGILFAKEDLFIKIKMRICKNMKSKIMGYALIFFFLYATFESCNIIGNIASIPFSSIACLLFGYVILSEVPIIREFLVFIGKHSANIFYVHTFLFMYWFPYTIYNLGNRWYIYFSVLFASLAISIIIECLKKIIKYSALEKKVILQIKEKFKSVEIPK